MLTRLKENQVIRALHEAALKSGAAKAYLVGGIVRDLLISGAVGRDFDFVIDGDKERIQAVAEALARKLCGSPFLLDKERGSYRIVLPNGLTVDVAALEPGGINEDLKKRDFTIDAMAVDVALLFARDGRGAIVLDPLGATKDIRDKALRLVYPNALDDDPLRALRAVRLSQQCGLLIAEETAAAVRASAASLRRVSIERVRDEFLHIFTNKRTPRALRELCDLGLIQVAWPWMGSWSDAQGYDLLAHALSVVEEAEGFLSDLGDFSRLKPFFDGKCEGLGVATALKLSAFLHDAGKPVTIKREGAKLSFTGHDSEGAVIVKRALTKLKFGKKGAALISAVVERHHRVFELSGLEEVTRRAKSRFFTSAGGEAGLLLLMLAVVDSRATRGSRDKSLERFVSGMVDFYFDEYAIREPRRLLSGADVMAEFGVSAGPLVGEIMALVAEGEEEGVVTDKASAIEYAALRLRGRG